MDNISLLTPLGYQFSLCGYCKKANGSPSYYCHGYRKMHPWHYESLANRMWRRSGTTYYKPDSKNACCPHYTIRLDADNFAVSKNQKQSSNRFTNYVIGEEYLRKAAKIFPKSRDQKKKRLGKFEVCDRVREPEWDELPKRQDVDGLEDVVPAHKFQVTLEPDTFTEEKYDLFEQYQRIVHKEPPSRISRSGFRDFLCSGMSRTIYEWDGKSRPIGSYHQCYRLDGRLVAIGVLDLLPHAVSSVYLIYQPELSEWEFGKLSALREIAMARERGYRYYYMGYYIHSCPKMKYKRTFWPTYVLDPESYEWMLFDADLLMRFENRKYVSLERERRLGLAPSNPDCKDSSDPSTSWSPKKGVSKLFESGMTGLVPLETIQDTIPATRVLFSYGGRILASQTITEDGSDVTIPYSMTVRLTEFIACIGIENLFQGQSGGILPALDWCDEDEEEDEGEET